MILSCHDTTTTKLADRRSLVQLNNGGCGLVLVMDQRLMTSSHPGHWKENKTVSNNLKVSSSKREESMKLRSEIIQKLIRDKEQEKAEAMRSEREKSEKEEKKKTSFRIPKKKPEEVSKLINSLFDDDTDAQEVKEQRTVPESKQENSSNHMNPDSFSLGHRESHSKPSSHRPSSHKSSATSKHSHGTSSDPSSSSHHHKSHSEQESSSNKCTLPNSRTSTSANAASYKPTDHHKHKSSTASDHHKHKSSSSTPSDHHKHKSSSSTPSDHHKHKSSSSTPSDHHKHKSFSAHKSSSQANPIIGSDQSVKSSLSKEDRIKSSKSISSKNHNSSSSKPNDPQSSSKLDLKPPSSSPPTEAQLTVSDQQPIVLNKHHLNPTVERQAFAGLSERERILARLQAIKQRTLEAIHKENSAKSRRMKGEKSHRKSKSEVKHDDKTKSAEIVRDIVSSDEEDPLNNGVPSALDIMLSERNAKLEKEKITRMAKQAWDRAMKKDNADSDKEIKIKKKHKPSKLEKTGTHKHGKSVNGDRKKHKEIGGSSSSQNHNSKKVLAKPKKPVIVRHSIQAPPPIDFKTLLAMAEKKQKEPTKPTAAIPKKKNEVDKRPLTQEEKDRKERMRSKEYQDWLKFGGKPPSKTNGSSDEDELKAPSSYNGENKRQLSSDRLRAPPERSKQTADSDHSRHKPQSATSGDKLRNITVHENVLVCGPAGSTDDERSPNRQENPFDRIMNKFHKKRPTSQSISAIPMKKNRLDDSEAEEEEYNSEMDDFIDDEDDVEPDYSKEIKKLFGYDKSKYKYEREEDLSDMEADYSTVMKEEKRSARLGLQEDLEDMRREQEELKRKAKMKKIK